MNHIYMKMKHRPWDLLMSLVLEMKNDTNPKYLKKKKKTLPC